MFLLYRFCSVGTRLNDMFRRFNADIVVVVADTNSLAIPDEIVAFVGAVNWSGTHSERQRHCFHRRQTFIAAFTDPLDLCFRGHLVSHRMEVNRGPRVCSYWTKANSKVSSRIPGKPQRTSRLSSTVNGP